MTTYTTKNASRARAGAGQSVSTNTIGLNFTTSAAGDLVSTHMDQALALATSRMNDAVHNHVVTLASRNGSTTAPGARYVHFANTTAKAIGLPKSDAAVIAALPVSDRASLAIIRAGIAARIPRWAAQVETEGGAKPHNRIRTLAAEWATTEALALRAVKIEDLVSRADALLLEVSQ